MAMIQSLKVALIQFRASADKKSNLEKIQNIFRQISDQVMFFALPELFNFKSSDPEACRQNAEDLENSPTINLLANLAKERKAWILAGSIYTKSNSHKSFNSSILIDPNSKITARYDKIHLFDVVLNSQKIFESDRITAGKQKIIAEMNGIKLGLSICYDLRFADLYHFYKGVEILTIPSAFTKYTGKAHWHCLLRARAIENQAYVIAPNQWGKSDDNSVECFGHSLIVDPWGKIIAEGGEDKDEVLIANLDLDYLRKIRQDMPLSTSHENQDRQQQQPD